MMHMETICRQLQRVRQQVMHTSTVVILTKHCLHSKSALSGVRPFMLLALLAEMLRVSEVLRIKIV